MLDGLISDATATITVISLGPTVIPEPSSLALLMLGMTTALTCRRLGVRRRVRRCGDGGLDTAELGRKDYE